MKNRPFKFDFRHFLTPLAGAIAGFFFQERWYQKVCVSNGQALKIGSCAHIELRLVLGALIGSLAWFWLGFALEKYFSAESKNRTRLSLALPALSFIDPQFTLFEHFIPSLCGLSFLMAVFSNTKELIHSLKTKRMNTWVLLFLNSFLILLITDGIYSWIGYHQLALTFPPQFIPHNWILIHFFIAAFYLLTRRLLLSSSLTFIIFAVINFSAGEKYRFLGIPLYPWDVQMTGEGAEILKTIFDPVALIAILTAGIAFFFVLLVNFYLHRRKQPQILHRFAFFLLASILVTFTLRSNTLSAEEIFPDFHGVRKSQTDKGAAYFLTLAYKVGINQSPPAEYSEASIKNIVEQPIQEKTESSLSGVNVVFYMIESFIDPSQMGVQYRNDPIPFFHAISEKHSSGHLVVPIFGGRTANTEFEVMTGLSVPQLLPGILAYYQLTGKTPALPWLFRSSGYSTHAFNGWTRDGFNWQKIYPSFGIDEFVALVNDKPTARRLYGLVSDEEIVDLVIDATLKDSTPAFVTVVTNSTHIPYVNRVPTNPKFEVLNSDLSAKTKDVFNRYAEVANHTDQALQRLIETLSKSSKKTVLIAYGDHLPGIGEAYDELKYFKSHRTERMHQVPLLIWTNLNVKREKLFLSSNFLGLKILKMLNFKKQGHFRLLNSLYQKLPVVSNFLMNSEQNTLEESTLDPQTTQQIKDYHLIQYDLIGGKHYLKTLTEIE